MTKEEKIKIVKDIIDLHLPLIVNGTERTDSLRKGVTVSLYWVQDVIRIDIKGFKRDDTENLK